MDAIGRTQSIRCRHLSLPLGGGGCLFLLKVAVLAAADFLLLSHRRASCPTRPPTATHSMNWNFSRTFPHFGQSPGTELDFFQYIWPFSSHSPKRTELNWRFSSSADTGAVSGQNELEVFQFVDTHSPLSCLILSGGYVHVPGNRRLSLHSPHPLSYFYTST